MTTELRDFTRASLEKGKTRDDIAGALKSAGWPEAEITAALDLYADVDFPVPVPKPKPYLSAREVFHYLVLFAALYVSAFNVGGLAFDFINRAFPDVLTDGGYDGYTYYSNSGIRWNIASLIVAFPLFLFMFRSVNNAIAKDPTKRGSRPRKWLTYLTLFLAGSTLAGDLVTLVYNVLGGELSARFLLKVLVVAILAGGIFTYFLVDMRKEER
ncbi:MAG: hypothetical protein RJB62_273 [Pseudomonadota bacterium]|jgi:hypothetical protein